MREELKKLNIDDETKEEPKVDEEPKEEPKADIKEDPKEVVNEGPIEPEDLDLSSIERVEQTRRFYDTHAQQYIDFESPVDEAALISHSHIDFFLARLKEGRDDGATTVVDLG